jgi:hypothetical protein
VEADAFRLPHHEMYCLLDATFNLVSLSQALAVLLSPIDANGRSEQRDMRPRTRLSSAKKRTTTTTTKRRRRRRTTTTRT